MNSRTLLSVLFLLNWTSWIVGQEIDDQQCGGEFYTDNYDTISSPGFPAPYIPGDDCIWHLRVPEGHVVKLTFAYLGTDPWPLAPQNCARHYVEVFDTPDRGGDLLGRYCGDIIPPVVLSTGNAMSVRFITSRWSTNIQGFHGFKAKFASVPEGSIVESGCRSPRKITDPTGTLTSIHFPSDYEDIVCKWEVMVEPGQNITLKLRSFHVGGIFPLKPLCDAETGRLTVHDGVGSDKNHLVSICGRMSDEETYSVTTATNQMTVEFRAGNTGPYKGFFATYQSSGYQVLPGVTEAQVTGSAHALRAHFPWCLSCLFAAAILLLRINL
ncbi:procollagen C-endopeptidase enhancer 1-like [Branchiostoma floridae x Branchiostoma japonicum]